MLTLFVVMNLTSRADAQDQWRAVTNKDGFIQAMILGEPETKVDKRKTLAGTVTTDVSIFRTENVQNTVTSTKLSRMIRRMISDEKKDGVLADVYGQEVSFEDIRIGGLPAKKLEYEMVDFDEVHHKGYRGVAVIIIHNNMPYLANAIIKKEAGEADLKKFRESVKINK